MRCALALCVALALTAACGGQSEETAPPRERERERERAAAPASEEGKRWGGWRWKGKADDCFFRVGNRCFDALAKACEAADCGDRECVHDDAAPARVSCEGDDPEALDRADLIEAAGEAEDQGGEEGAAEDEAAEDEADEDQADERERDGKRERRKRRRGKRGR